MLYGLLKFESIAKVKHLKKVMQVMVIILNLIYVKEKKINWCFGLLEAIKVLIFRKSKTSEKNCAGHGYNLKINEKNYKWKWIWCFIDWEIQICLQSLTFYIIVPVIVQHF